MNSPDKTPAALGYYSKPLTQVGQIVHPSLRLCFEYWLGKKAGAPAPRAAAFDILDLSALAPNLAVVDVKGPETFVVRMLGTTIVDRLGADMTGMDIADLPPGEFVDTCLALYKAVVAEKQPFWHEPKRSVFPNREHISYEYIVLPLLGESGSVEQIVTAVEFTEIVA